MLFPTYPQHVAERIEKYHDDVRYSTLALAIRRLEKDIVPGDFAEIGVYQGATSSFIHQQAPGRKFYLFDTFEGFPESGGSGRDERFKDTSVEAVRKFLGNSENIKFRKGYFPETASGLEDEKFSLVILDVDRYLSALDVFHFFYPRMVRGGYFFMHDFNSPESGQAVSRAALEFMFDKPEFLIEIPDYFGSAMFRKV